MTPENCEPGMTDQTAIERGQQLQITKLKEELEAIYKEANEIMDAKGSYNVPVDRRVLEEYGAAYRFIRKLGKRARP